MATTSNAAMRQKTPFHVPIFQKQTTKIMAATAVICLGNRYVPGDDVGCRVFDHLAGSAAPPDVEIIDGGLCGLDLLRLVEGRRCVVFADAVIGLAEPGTIVVLSREQVADYAERYGHGAGLPYLLRLLPQVCRPPLPEIALVGAEGEVDEGTVRTLAERCMEIAIHGTA
jgi:hydrogenase maturation protease